MNRDELCCGEATDRPEEFFPELVCRLARALNVRYAIVTELIRGDDWACCPLAFCSGQKLIDLPSYEIRNTPCDIVLRLGSYFCADGLSEKFPEDPHFEELAVRSYRGMAIRGEDGEIVGHLGVLDDRPMKNSSTAEAIMEAYSTAASLEIRRRRAERERREAAERLSKLVEAIPDPICLKNAEGQWLYANRALIDLLHLNGIEWGGKTDLELGEIQPQFANQFREVSRIEEEVWQTRQSRVREVLLSENGDARLFEMVHVPLFDGSGNRQGIASVARDVTVQRNTETALRRSEEKIRSIAEHVPGAIYSYIWHPDRTRTLLYVSPGLTDLIGAQAVTDLSGNSERFASERVHAEDQQVFEDAMNVSSRTFRPLGHDFRILTEAGTYKWVRSISQPVRAGEGELLWYGMLLEINDRRDAGSGPDRFPAEWQRTEGEISTLDQLIGDLATPLVSLVGCAGDDDEAQATDRDQVVRRVIARLGEELLQAFHEYTQRNEASPRRVDR